MNAEFNWWLLIVGLGIGAGLAWLVLADMSRRREAASARERAEEVAWIRDALGADDAPDETMIDRVIELHERWTGDLDPSAADSATVADPGPDRPTAEDVIETASPGDGDPDPAGSDGQANG